MTLTGWIESPQHLLWPGGCSGGRGRQPGLLKQKNLGWKFFKSMHGRYTDLVPFKNFALIVLVLFTIIPYPRKNHNIYDCNKQWRKCPVHQVTLLNTGSSGESIEGRLLVQVKMSWIIFIWNFWFCMGAILSKTWSCCVIFFIFSGLLAHIRAGFLPRGWV